MVLSIVLASNGTSLPTQATNKTEARRDARLVLRDHPNENAVYIVLDKKILDVMRRCNLSSECVL